MFKGKAGSLKFLKSIGLKVPEFSVIEHSTFVSWGDVQLFAKLELSLKSKNQAAVFEAAKNFIQSVLIPDLKLNPDNYYAVRSSALLEDSPEHSFAGIFETSLFVKDHKTEIKKVWSSLFTPKSLQYCIDRGLSWSDLSMDVVIQEMIDGDRSGVLFQADPMGKITEQIIVAGYGIGQGIVDEETDTDRYIIENYEIRESFITKKDSFLRFSENKIVKDKVPAQKSSISVLSQSDIEKLLTASNIIGGHSDHFMDVEFTFRSSELFVLQARPITTLPSRKFINVFDNSNVAENYPGLSLPLTFSALQRGYGKNFKNLIRFMGVKDDDWSHINNQLEQLVGYWGGQIYYNLNNWYSVYTLLPFGTEKAVSSFNEMVGINSSSIISIPERSLSKKIRMLAGMLPAFISYYFRGGTHHQRYKKQFTHLYANYRKSSDDAKSTFEIIKLVEGLDNEYLSIIKIPLFNDFF